jgi:hypothetical protein
MFISYAMNSNSWKEKDPLGNISAILLLFGYMEWEIQRTSLTEKKKKLPSREQ